METKDSLHGSCEAKGRSVAGRPGVEVRANPIHLKEPSGLLVVSEAETSGSEHTQGPLYRPVLKGDVLGAHVQD